MESFVFVLLVSSLLSEGSTSFAIAGSSNNVKVVNGTEALPHEFPFMAQIRYQTEHTCAGAIINEEWIVTTASCASEHSSTFTATLGEYDHSVHEGPEQNRSVVRIVTHPDYVGYPSYMNDIALLQISPPMVFNEFVQPAKLPAVGFVPSARATYVGWGGYQNNSILPSKVLRKADVPTFTDPQCSFILSKPVEETYLCAGSNGTGVCIVGELGSGLVCQDTLNNPVLCGLVSGSEQSRCRTPTLPNMNTEISHYVDWIQSEITSPPPITNSTWAELDGKYCGGVLVGDSCRLRYKLGEKYNNEELCVWTIRMEDYSSIRIHLEQDGLIDGDYVEVTEVNPHDAQAERRRSTRLTKNEDRIFSGPVVLIVFKSDELRMGTGFSLTFKAEGHQNSTGLTHINYHLGNGSAHYFRYPEAGDFGPDEFVTFVFTPPSKHARLSLEETHFSGVGNNCIFTFVSIQEYQQPGFTSPSKYCGENLSPKTFESTEGLIVLWFKSDGPGRFFYFSWSS